MIRFTRIRGHAYKVVPIPHDLDGKLAVIDHDERVIFTDARLDTEAAQRSLLEACRMVTEQRPPGGKEAA